MGVSGGGTPPVEENHQEDFYKAQNWKVVTDRGEHENLQYFLNICDQYIQKEEHRDGNWNYSTDLDHGFFSAVIYSGITQFGIFSLDAELEKNYFIFVGMLCVLLFIFAGFLSAILESYECSHCEYCNRDLAYDKIGITLVEEITENGVIKEVTTKKYRCRFCGHMKYKIDKSEKYPDPI